MANAKRDENRIPTTLGLSEDGVTLLDFKVNPLNGNLKVTNAGGGPVLYYLSPLYMNGSTVVSNTIGSTFFPAQGNLNAQTTYADAAITLNTAGFLQYLTCHIQANSATASAQVTIDKNTSSTPLTITVPAGITGLFTTTTATTSIAANDTVAYEVIRTDTGNISFNYIGCWYGTADGTSRSGASGNIENNGNTIRHHRLNGVGVGLTANAFSLRTYFSEAGTIKTYTFNVASNAKTTDTTVNLQIDDIATAFSATIPGGITGQFTVTVGTSVVAGDWCHLTTLNTTSGTNLLSIRTAGFEFTTGVAGRIQTFAGSPSSGVVFNSTSRSNYGLPVGAAQGVASVARVAIVNPVDITIVRGFAMVGTNSLNANADIDLRIGATQYLPVTVTTGTANTTFDNTISQSVVANSQISMGISTALATSGSIITYSQMTYTVAGIPFP